MEELWKLLMGIETKLDCLANTLKRGRGNTCEYYVLEEAQEELQRVCDTLKCLVN